MSEVVINGERYYAESELVAALACAYPDDGVLVARICDKHLGRSGRLLGIVRDVAMENRRAAFHTERRRQGEATSPTKGKAASSVGS